MTEPLAAELDQMRAELDHVEAQVSHDPAAMTAVSALRKLIGKVERLKGDLDGSRSHVEALKREITEVSLVARKTADDNDRLQAELTAVKSNRLINAIFGHHAGAPRPFALQRAADRTLVALGAEFPDGATALRLVNDGGWYTASDGGAEYWLAGRVRLPGGGRAELAIIGLSDELESLAEMERERDTLRARIAELDALFDLQWSRMQAATALWRHEDPAARSNVLPDLAQLLDWFIAKLTAYEQEREATALPSIEEGLTAALKLANATREADQAHISKLWSGAGELSTDQIGQ